MDTRSSLLIAALASKPQLITLALDCLARMGELPQRLLVVHTDSRYEPMKSSLTRLHEDLQMHYPKLSCRFLPFVAQDNPLRDVISPDEVQASFRMLYAEVHKEKLDEARIHFLISGGRRTLTAFGMAIAQMLFDDDDRLWHIASHPDLEKSAALHARGDEWVRLIPIPVIIWGRLSPVFASLRGIDDPFLAFEKLTQLRLQEQWDLARIFILTLLTPAERQIVRLLVGEGCSQAEIAEQLAISPRTVEQHLRAAYRKAADHWELETVNQTQLVRLLGIYFTGVVM